MPSFYLYKVDLLTSVSPEDLLVPEGHPAALRRSRRLHALQFDAGHGAFGHLGTLLEVLEHQLPAGSPSDLATVGTGVVRQPSSVGNALDHLERTNPKDSIKGGFHSF